MLCQLKYYKCWWYWTTVSYTVGGNMTKWHSWGFFVVLQFRLSVPGLEPSTSVKHSAVELRPHPTCQFNIHTIESIHSNVKVIFTSKRSKAQKNVPTGQWSDSGGLHCSPCVSDYPSSVPVTHDRKNCLWKFFLLPPHIHYDIYIIHIIKKIKFLRKVCPWILW